MKLHIAYINDIESTTILGVYSSKEKADAVATRPTRTVRKWYLNEHGRYNDIDGYYEAGSYEIELDASPNSDLVDSPKSIADYDKYLQDLYGSDWYEGISINEMRKLDMKQFELEESAKGIHYRDGVKLNDEQLFQYLREDAEKALEDVISEAKKENITLNINPLHVRVSSVGRKVTEEGHFVIVEISSANCNTLEIMMYKKLINIWSFIEIHSEW